MVIRNERVAASRHSWNLRGALLVSWLLTAGLLGSAWAQAPSSPAKKDEAAVSIEAIEQRIKELRTQYAAKADEKLKEELLAEYRKRTAYYVKEAAEYESQRRRTEREASGAAAETSRIEQELRSLAEPLDVALPADVKIAELDALIEQRQKAVGDARRERERISQRKAAHQARRGKLEEELRSVHERLEQARSYAKAADEAAKARPDAAAPAAAESEPQDLVDARKASWDARRLWLTNWAAALAAEKQSYDTIKGLLDQRLKLAEAQLRRAELVSKLTAELVSQRRRETAEGQLRMAEEDLRRESHPLLHELAEKNVELAARRLELITLAQQAFADFEQRATQVQELQDVAQRTKKTVETVGLTSAVGMLLRNQRARLPSLEQCRLNLRARQPKIREAQYQQLVVEDERRELERQWDQRLSERQAAVVDAAAVAPESADAVALRQRTADLMAANKEFLELVAKDAERYFKRMVELDVEEQKLIDESQQFAAFIDERILWVRSAERLDLRDVAAAGRAAQWLLGPAAWRDLGAALTTHLRDEPAGVISLALCVFLPWAAVQRRLRKRIVDLGNIAAARTAQQFWPTAEALGHTLLLAGFTPALLWFFAWQIDRSAAATQVALAAAEGLRTVAQLLFPLNCLRQMCRSKGLAESHLNWPPAALRILAARLRRLAWIGMPMAYIAGALRGQENESWDAALGRAAFVVLLLLFAKLLYGLLRPSGVVIRELAGGNSHSILYRMRHAAFAAGVLGPLFGAVLAGIGFYYTAWQLAVCCVSTIYLGVGILIVGALVRRWLTLNHRRMAIEQRRQALREQMAAAQEAGGAASVAGIVTELPPELDLSAVSDQTRRLLNVSLLASAVCGAWFIWSGVLPALNLLDQVGLWATTEGGQERTVTLGNVLLCGLLLVVTGAAARNVPGLLQITVLQRLPIDSGMRYALDNVSRYVIVVVGAAVGLSVIGVGWAKVQWLIAAVSVGLGFGLQEIFANFVSGLIVLFERPIRVGDIVTIDGTTGVVSKIRIRATTITNWDRQELIVPNKDLITGKLLNWTLSDNVNRVVVNVGVAYGTDTRRVTELLMKIAVRQPGILREPAPSVTFESFGDSTLNFVLRGYLDNLDHRRDVVHDLHMAINDEFAAAGIEIAFPQRDIHIRSLVMPGQAGGGASQSPAVGPQSVFPMGPPVQQPAKMAG